MFLCVHSVTNFSRNKTNIKRTGWTNTCLCTVSAAPSYVGQVLVHRGARTNCFRIGEEGTRRLSS